jgi:multidrug efflux pump subunit AcrB
VLAIGIVVDDAIVVVENVERNSSLGQSPREAARSSMDEVSGALVAIMLVLCAVFVPTFFLTGLSGAFYRQFALVISAATVISLILSLTLSPAGGAMLLRHEDHDRVHHGWRGILHRLAEGFTRFDRFSGSYGRLTTWLVARPKSVMLSYQALVAATVGLFWATPTGFIPPQDQSYLITLIQLPPGSAPAGRTPPSEVSKRILQSMVSAERSCWLATMPLDPSRPTPGPFSFTLLPFDQRSRHANDIRRSALEGD